MSRWVWAIACAAVVAVACSGCSETTGSASDRAENATSTITAGSTYVTTGQPDATDDTDSGPVGPAGGQESDAVGTDAPEDLRPPYVGDITFGWPTGCAVSLATSKEVDGHRIGETVSIALSSQDEGLLVAMSRPTGFLDPGVPELDGLTRYMDLVVDDTGVIVDLRSGPFLEEDIRKYPSIKEGLEDAARRSSEWFWSNNVTAWVNIGKIADLTFEIPSPSAPGPVTVRSLPAPTGRARIEFSVAVAEGTTIEGPSGSLPIEGELDLTSTVEMDPRTARPFWVHLQTSLDDEAIRVERWEFDWEGSDCPS